MSYYALKLLKRHFLKMRPQIFDAQTDINSSGRCSYFTVYNGRRRVEGDSSSSFSETETDLKLSVSVYYSTETVTPHSIASLSLPVPDSDGGDSTILER